MLVFWDTKNMGITEYLTTENLTNVDYIRTGDILLFTNEPRRGSMLIITSTRSPWVHVGVAVWSDTLPRKLMVLESTRGRVAYDELTEEIRRGVRLTELKNIVDEYQAIHIRRLNIERNLEFYTKLNQFMEDWKGVPYVSLLKIPFIPYTCFEDPGVSCSELVARFMKYMGLFEGSEFLTDYCIKNFLPGHFAPETELNTELRDLFEDTPCPMVYSRGVLMMDTILLLSLMAFITFLVFLVFVSQQPTLKIEY
jgi:hypothetical protein